MNKSIPLNIGLRGFGEVDPVTGRVKDLTIDSFNLVNPDQFIDPGLQNRRMLFEHMTDFVGPVQLYWVTNFTNPYADSRPQAIDPMAMFRHFANRRLRLKLEHDEFCGPEQPYQLDAILGVLKHESAGPIYDTEGLFLKDNK